MAHEFWTAVHLLSSPQTAPASTPGSSSRRLTEGGCIIMRYDPMLLLPFWQGVRLPSHGHGAPLHRESLRPTSAKVPGTTTKPAAVLELASSRGATQQTARQASHQSPNLGAQRDQTIRRGTWEGQPQAAPGRSHTGGGITSNKAENHERESNPETGSQTDGKKTARQSSRNPSLRT